MYTRYTHTHTHTNTHTHTHTHLHTTHTHTGWIGEDTEDDIDEALGMVHTPHSPRGADEENGYSKPAYTKLPVQAPAVPPLNTTPFRPTRSAAYQS